MSRARSRGPGGCGRTAARAGAFALAAVCVGCAAPPVPDYTERIERAERGRGDEPLVAARRAEVEAAIARESSETAIDEVELRIENTLNTENSDTRDNRLRITTRVPLPDPSEVRARRDARRAETDAALSRLDETALELSAARCLRAVEVGSWRAITEIYAAYASTYARLIEWNDESQRAGRISEPLATRFEIESRINLVTQMPDPVPLVDTGEAALPALEPAEGTLVTRPELVRRTVRDHSPVVSIHEAIARRYRALAQREDARGRPWPTFFDLVYEGNANEDRREAGAQIAFRVPLGPSASEKANRFEALSRSERRQSAGELEERVRLGLIALREIDAFERNIGRWLELLDLAVRAEATAQRWWEQRLATPDQVGRLFDRAHEARRAVVEARDRAGTARCALLATTGVALADWPREPARGPILPRRDESD